MNFLNNNQSNLILIEKTILHVFPCVFLYENLEIVFLSTKFDIATWFHIVTHQVNSKNQTITVVHVEK